VLTDVGPFEVDVPRDPDASFEPRIVAKRQKRLAGVDELGRAGHLAVGEGVLDAMSEWPNGRSAPVCGRAEVGVPCATSGRCGAGG
jgi:hypothetical protein